MGASQQMRHSSWCPLLGLTASLLSGADGTAGDAGSCEADRVLSAAVLASLDVGAEAWLSSIWFL